MIRQFDVACSEYHEFLSLLFELFFSIFRPYMLLDRIKKNWRLSVSKLVSKSLEKLSKYLIEKKNIQLSKQKPFPTLINQGQSRILIIK